MAKNVDTAAGFQSHLGDVQSLAFVAHGIALGSNLGLFETIAKLDKPATCETIATAAGYRERYVREWLGLMVTGKIIDYDVTAKTYHVSEHKKPFLTEAGKDQNASIFIAGTSIATNASRDVEACFIPDAPRGVPYSRYPGFHDWRKAHVKVTFQWLTVEETLKQTSGLVETMERGGARVCDAGCSTGIQLCTMAKKYPKSTFVGVDIDKDAVEAATESAKKLGLSNTTFEVEDGCNMPADWSNTYDALFVWDVVHDVPHSAKFLREIIRVLKPGGLFFMMDINVHTNLGDNMSNMHTAVYYGMSFYHCMPVSLYHESGEGLGAAWGVEKQRQYLEDAGFVKIQQIHPTKDKSHSYFVAYKQTE